MSLCVYLWYIVEIKKYCTTGDADAGSREREREKEGKKRARKKQDLRSECKERERERVERQKRSQEARPRVWVPSSIAAKEPKKQKHQAIPHHSEGREHGSRFVFVCVSFLLFMHTFTFCLVFLALLKCGKI